MYPSSLAPRVRIMAVCDGIRESRMEPGVYHLKGVRQGLAARAFPFMPRRLWLYLHLSSPRPGRFPGYIVIVNAATDRVVFYSTLLPHPAFSKDIDSLTLRARLYCTFPEAGHYLVQIWFFQTVGSDKLKGELPFSVWIESD